MKSIRKFQHFTDAMPKRFFSQTPFRCTTVCCVRKGPKVGMVADGQVTLGNTVSKKSAKKLRILGKGDHQVITGFAGAATDGLTLNEKLEGYLEEFPGQLKRAAVEMAKDWRQDKFLRKLEAMMVVADGQVTLLVSGSGDVLESDDDVCAIGSGGEYARSAARGIMSVENDLTATEIAHKALQIAADICIYSNQNLTKAEIDVSDKKNILVRYDEHPGSDFL